jgi:hypothetical protein
VDLSELVGSQLLRGRCSFVEVEFFPRVWEVLDFVEVELFPRVFEVLDFLGDVSSNQKT